MMQALCCSEADADAATFCLKHRSTRSAACTLCKQQKVAPCIYTGLTAAQASAVQISPGLPFALECGLAMAAVDSSQQAPSGSQTVLCRDYSYEARGGRQNAMHLSFR